MIEVGRKSAWGIRCEWDGEMKWLREREREWRTMKEKKKKELSASTKDNIIKLRHKAVVPTVTKLWRLKCECLCPSADVMEQLTPKS